MIGAALLDGTPVSFEQTTERLRLIVPQQLRQPGNTVVKLQLAQPATEIAPIEPW